MKNKTTDLAGLAARENGNDSNPDQKSQTEIKIIDSERKLFAEQYEKYLHLCSDQSNHIKELEQKIADMEYNEKYL